MIKKEKQNQVIDNNASPNIRADLEHHELAFTGPGTFEYSLIIVSKTKHSFTGQSSSYTP